MTNLPEPLRVKPGGHVRKRSLELLRKQGSRDVTQKFLWKLDDGVAYRERSDTRKPCSLRLKRAIATPFVSPPRSAAPTAAAFARAAWKVGKRNLRVDEIVDQVLAVEKLNEAQGLAAKNPGSDRLVSNSGDHGDGRAPGKLRRTF
jgi:adenine C2-methylase RlmN of 23S rRNA A2503 and tRNA A37